MQFKFPHILLLLFLSLVSNEPFLFFCSGALLLYILYNFWRDNEPKHILVNMLLYWAVVSIIIPYSTLIGKSYNDITRYGKSDLRLATWVGLGALTAYIFAVQISLRRVHKFSFETIRELIEKYESTKIIYLYLSISILSAVLDSSIIKIPGAQLLLSVTFMKWVILTILIAQVAVTNDNQKLVLLIICAEILLSFSGFWAAFKNYIIVAIGAYLFLTPKLTWRTYVLLTMVSFLTLFISVVWTYSKGEYRRYLTGGERSQYVIQQNEIENIFRFIEIAQKDFSANNFSSSFAEGLENLVYRISYVEFLAMTMNQVPTYLPHENGRLLQNAVEHILKPRILFPDKKPIYDSELTSKYTGRKFSGVDEGTSFSLGTVAEAYVDFGIYYMLIPIFIFGFWVGWMYKYFIMHGYNILWGMCYSAPIFQFAWSFPVTTSKFLGWSVTYFITFWFINKYLIKYIDRWLLKPEYKS